MLYPLKIFKFFLKNFKKERNRVFSSKNVQFGPHTDRIRKKTSKTPFFVPNRSLTKNGKYCKININKFKEENMKKFIYTIITMTFIFTMGLTGIKVSAKDIVIERDDNPDGVAPAALCES